MFSGLFAPLLRQLVSHFPQLCSVRDWLYEASDIRTSVIEGHSKNMSPTEIDIKEGKSKNK